MKNVTLETLERAAKREGQRTYKQKVSRVKNFGQVKVTVCKNYNPGTRNTIKVKGDTSYWNKKYARVSTL